MPIPDFDEDNGYLPPGDHPATFGELEARFGTTYRRRQMLAELSWVVERLRGFGVLEIYVDGGFVTGKERPRDIEVVYVADPASRPETWGLLAPGRRQELKKQFRIDLWRYPSPQPVQGQPGQVVTIKEFFSTDRDDVPKGLVKLIENEEDH